MSQFTPKSVCTLILYCSKITSLEFFEYIRPLISQGLFPTCSLCFYSFFTLPFFLYHLKLNFSSNITFIKKQPVCCSGLDPSTPSVIVVMSPLPSKSIGLPKLCVTKAQKREIAFSTSQSWEVAKQEFVSRQCSFMLLSHSSHCVLESWLDAGWLCEYPYMGTRLGKWTVNWDEQIRTGHELIRA